ncbi:16S rRNA (uracil(1498)-N(3))-methyltransferase [Isachenkonia alkalipeptolytica]|uniref:Ribosomal RNA small subunit methyltransferase E n=1 Tax=Isachenkonia alkalipeptolytica TaxID=2565777 RepID=A0AA43XL92_9CLOT|nr:16S rRNA (uracil(1498)-N(3))-methyltransferase [Isachenkonia alkalipeptolytica]NBG87935.1 16S rRNA (uracil(1498)-N(3))-methyltransferase [Isachenkonia alkalipeptolytica]
MHRFFVDKCQVQEESAYITGEDAKHLEKVLRLKVGDIIELVVGEELEYLGEITVVEGKSTQVKLLELKQVQRESPLEITLYQGLPKASKMELIIQKAVELGIKRIVPVMNQRSVVQLKTKKDQQKKQERWQKIAYEAAKQSKRIKVPEITLPMEFNRALDNSFEEFQIVAYEDEEKKGIKDLTFLHGNKDQEVSRATIGLWVGPEGGFAEQEIESLKKIGANTVTLGPRILRTETAGLALLTMVQYESGDLGG